MPKIVDEAAQRRRIRGAARDIFARRGVATTGLAHVARAAGMRRSSLYHYYSDKASLIRDLAEEMLTTEEAMFVEALRGEGNALERVERLTAGVVALFDERRAVGRLLLELWATEPETIRPVLRRVRRLLADLLRSGQGRGEVTASLDPEATAALLVGLMDGLLVQVFIDPDEVRADAGLEASLISSVRRLLAP